MTQHKLSAQLDILLESVLLKILWKISVVVLLCCSPENMVKRLTQKRCSQAFGCQWIVSKFILIINHWSMQNHTSRGDITIVPSCSIRYFQILIFTRAAFLYTMHQRLHTTTIEARLIVNASKSFRIFRIIIPWSWVLFYANCNWWGW